MMVNEGPDCYKLDDNHELIPCHYNEYYDWRKKDKQRAIVAKTIIGDTEVSTVFLGVNHCCYFGPVTFETLIFGGKHDMYIERYRTWNMAERGHKRIVEAIKNGTLDSEVVDE